MRGGILDLRGKYGDIFWMDVVIRLDGLYLEVIVEEDSEFDVL